MLRYEGGLGGTPHNSAIGLGLPGPRVRDNFFLVSLTFFWFIHQFFTIHQIGESTKIGEKKLVKNDTLSLDSGSESGTIMLSKFQKGTGHFLRGLLRDIFFRREMSLWNSAY